MTVFTFKEKLKLAVVEGLVDPLELEDVLEILRWYCCLVMVLIKKKNHPPMFPFIVRLTETQGRPRPQQCTPLGQRALSEE